MGLEGVGGGGGGGGGGVRKTDIEDKHAGIQEHVPEKEPKFSK